jgi:hypothetical protein
VFAPGVTSLSVAVVVNGDTVDESDETLFVNLSGVINASIADGQGRGTIIDDDGVVATGDDVKAQNERADKLTICHVPPGNPENTKTITVGARAASSHLARHADSLGVCDSSSAQ